MPVQQIVECDDCGHTYDQLIEETCPNCTKIDNEDNLWK